MLAGFGQASEARQFRQRHIHAEGARTDPESLDPAPELGVEIALGDHSLVQELRSDIGDRPRAFGLQLPFVPGFLPGVGSYPFQQRPAWRRLRSAWLRAGRVLAMAIPFALIARA